MRTREPAPERLVSEGRLVFGSFDGPIAQVNPLEARRPFALPLPRALRAWRLKEWQAVQFGNGHWFANVALFNTKSLALVQVKLYDRVGKRKFLYEKKLPPWSFRVARGLLDSETAYRSAACSLRFRNRLADQRLELELEVRGGRGFPALAGAITALCEGCDPLVVSIPFGANRGMYSHKGLVRAEGSLQIAGEAVPFARDQSYALIDDHKGTYPAELVWDWVTGAGWVEGRLLGFNLTRNQSTDPERYNENCLWLDGRVSLLPPVRFERSGSEPGDSWRIRDKEGRVELRFDVEVGGRVDINVPPFRCRYRGPFGSFGGQIVDAGGAAVSVDGLFGMGEDFLLRC